MLATEDLYLKLIYLSRLQKVEARNLIKPAYACAVHQFKQNGLHNVPHLYTGPYASGNSVFIPTAGRVHVKNGVALVIREQSANTGHFVNIFQRQAHGDNGRSPAVFRPYYQSAAFVGAAEDHQGRRLDGMFLCKRLDGFMDDIAIFQADYKDTSQFGFRIFYGL
jgi:hypothetical protein